MTEDEMVGWHHRLNRHEFEQTLGNNEGLGSLACCSPWGCRVRQERMTEQQQNFKTQMWYLGCAKEKVIQNGLGCLDSNRLLWLRVIVLPQRPWMLKNTSHFISSEE